jgi:neutral ceramidase
MDCMIRTFANLWLFLVFASQPGSNIAAEAVLLAGAAHRDITPQEPVPMWGYGARHDILSRGTLDPLQASALVIQAGDEKLAIVGLDLGRSPSEQSLQRIRERIKADAGIAHSFLAGSHTHHGPVVELTNEKGKGQGKFDSALRYYTLLEDEIVAAIVDANQKLVPSQIAAGSVQLDGFNRNRHSKLLPKPVDSMLGVLRLDTMDGKPIAVLVNFAGHPTSVPGEKLQFSADYVGAMRNQIEKSHGGTAIFMQGACGDLSINRGSHPDHVAFGEALGQEAVKLVGTLKPQVPPKPSLKVREERFRFESRVNLNNPITRIAYSVAFFPELINNFADEYAEGIRPHLTVALLNGEIALVGGSGEFFCQHAIRLRERARVPHLFFLGYSNGYHQYFPTIEAAAEGGYGADSQVAPVAIGAGEQLMNTALIWLFQMQGKALE